MVDYFTSRGLPPLRRNVGGPPYPYPVYDQPDLLSGTARPSWLVDAEDPRGIIGIGRGYSLEHLGEDAGGFGPGDDPGETGAAAFSRGVSGPLPPEAPKLLQQEVSGEQRSPFYGPDIAGAPLVRPDTQEGQFLPSNQWYNPDTGEFVNIEGETDQSPMYHSTMPMGYAPHDPNRQTGFFSNLGRRLMGGVTAPYRHFTDISDVPVTGSGIGAAASTFGPLLASAAIPGGGLFSLLSRMIPDSGPTPYQQEGRNVSDISFGPKTAWLGADVPGGGYYIPNQKIDMAQLGGGRTPGGRGITVHTPEGLVDATYRVDPTGAASITSKGFGAPGVDYGDLYYGGADYEGLDTGQFDDIFSGDEDWF